MLRLLVMGALLAVTVAGASHTPIGRCDSGNYQLGMVEISGGTAESTFYVDDRNSFTGGGTWVYHESNGIWSGTDVAHDLQRGGVAVWDVTGGTLGAETCTDDPNVTPDTLLL